MIPTIHISLHSHENCIEKENVLLKMRMACESFGCFAVAIDSKDIQLDRISKVYVDSSSFYMFPVSVKKKYNARCNTSRRGWLRLTKDDTIGECCVTKSERGESYTIGDEQSNDDGGNIWPEELPGLKENLIPLFEYTTALSQRVLEYLAEMLQLPEQIFSEYCNEKGTSPLRILNYRSREYHLPSDTSGDRYLHLTEKCEHKSRYLLTLFHQDTMGLEIKNRQGQWIEVPVALNQFIVLIGEIFEMWTNSIIPATIYRDKDVPYRRQIIERNIGIDPLINIEPFQQFVSTENPPHFRGIIAKNQIVHHRLRTSTLLRSKILEVWRKLSFEKRRLKDAKVTNNV